MKAKFFLVVLLTAAVFSFAQPAMAMTDAENQALIAQLQAQIQSLTEQIAALIAQQSAGTTASATGNAWCHTFNNNLGWANTGSSEVYNLHLALQKEGISYSPDDENTYNTGTSDGVVEFQAKYGISQTGYFGTLTRTKMNLLYGCVAETITESPALASDSWCHDFEIDLRKGDSGLRIIALQEALTKEGFDVGSDPSGIFGDATFAAVVKFQEKYASEILTPYYLKAGTGFVGQSTRKKLNALYGCAVPLSASIKITAPVYKENIKNGTSYTIKWTATNIADDLKINIIFRSNSNVLIASNVLASAGLYEWAIPTDFTGNGYIQIVGINNAVSAKGDNFNVGSTSTVKFVFPVSDGAKLYAGEQYQLSWIISEAHQDERINIYLVNNSTGEKTIIEKDYYRGLEGTHNNIGRYRWTVPTLLSRGEYKIYIEGKVCGDPAVLFDDDVCNDFMVYSPVFSVLPIAEAGQPTISILAPTTGEILTTYSTYDIKWQQENLAGYKVDIAAIRYNTTGFEQQPVTIATGVDASLGTYAWSVPYTMGAQTWRIKISSNFTTSLSQIKTGAGYTEAQGGYFKINHGKRIKVEAPNGGQTLNYDTTYNIRWITGNITTVNISLVNSATGAQYTIATNVPSATTDFIYSYSFKPTTVYPQGSYKFLIADSSDATIKDYSDNDFTIGNTVATCTENWSCDPWSACSNSMRTKKCTDLNNCGTTVNKPATSEYCSSWSCTPNWTCTWSACVNGWKSETCTDSNNCGTVSPASTKTCTTCAPNWVCEWGACVNGYKTKSLVDKNNCGQSSSTSGVVCTTEVASCTDAGSSITTDAPNGGETLYAGDTYNIRWTSNGLSTVNINLQNYSTGGLYYSIARNVPASQGSYSWRVGYTVDNVLVPSGENYKILVGYGDKNDYSNNYFTIADRNAPTVRVVSPNGGENWTHGSTHTITWTAANMGNINIFAKNVSTGVSATIAANIPSSAGSYTWTLPPTSTAAAYSLSAGQYKVWIIGTTMVNWAYVEDYSDSSIAISNQVVAPQLTVISPNGGETLTQNTSAAISWETSGITGYGLAVYLKNMDTGASYAIKTGSTATAGSSSYSWAVPSTVPAGSRYKVYVYAWDSIGNSVEDYGDGYVTVATGVQYYIRVNSPNGGEQLTKGVAHNITWSTNYSSPTTSTVNIFLTMAGALNETTIATNVPVGAGSYSWTPQWTGNGKVRVQYVALTDSSDNYFTVSEFDVVEKSITVLSPNGGQTWYKDTSYLITWSAPNVSKVNIYLTEAFAGGRTHIIATDVVASTGSYYWRIPTTYVNNIYKIMIVDTSDLSLKDYSNSEFIIVSRIVPPAVKINSPNGGELFNSTNTYNITWDNTNLESTSKIRIELWDDDSVPTKITTIASGLSSTVESYSWTIAFGFKAGSKYKIKAQVYSPTSTGGEVGVTNDYSDAYFSINVTSATPTIEVLTPLRNATYTDGGYITATWQSTNVDKITIKLFGSDNTSIQSVVSAGTQYIVGTNIDASLGRYRFSIPAGLELPSSGSTGGTYRVLVSDQNSTISDYSEIFYIQQALIR